MVMRAQHHKSDVPILIDAQRLAWGVTLVAQTILGIGLFSALTFKYAMLLFSGIECGPNPVNLSDKIRCTSSLFIVAQFLFGMAGFRFASFLFQDRLRAVFGPLTLACTATFLVVLSRVLSGDGGASSALLLLALAVTLSITYASQSLFSQNRHGNTQQSQRNAR